MTAIDLGGASVPNGDGLLLEGDDLYVVQNFLGLLTLVELDDDLTTGEVVASVAAEVLAVEDHPGG